MIAIVGIMIGLYVLARTASHAGQADEGVIAKLLAAVAFFGNALGILILMFGGVR